MKFYTNKKIIQCVNLMLITLLIFLLYQLIVILLMTKPLIRTQLSSRAGIDHSINRWDWYTPTQDVNDQSKLKQSQLNASVVGVIGSGENGLALIRFSGRPEKLYKVGDNLNANASLEAIEKNRIVVRESGKLFELPLMKLGKDVFANSNLISKNQTNSVVSPMQLSGMARMIPVQIDGDTGVKLEDLAEGIAELSELQENDVIMSVEEKNISDLMHGNDWQSMLQRTDVDVDLIRNGQRVTVQVNVASLTEQMLRQIQLK